MTTTSAPPTEPPPTQIEPPPQFVHRVVRVVALILLAYAALHVLQYLLALVIHGSWWAYTGGGGLRRFERAIQFSTFGNLLLLGVGAAGMRAWKGWARAAVMLWAILYIVLQFASATFWILEYARQLPATPPTTQVAAGNQPLWQYMLMFAFSWVGSALFPLLVWLILRQPEVAALFVRPRSGGFEVVPFAQPAAATPTSPPPSASLSR